MEGAKQQISSQVNDIQKQMPPGQTIQLPSSSVELLNGHMDRIQDSFSSIASRLNVPLPQPSKSDPSSSGVAHYLDYLTGGQKQLQTMMDSMGDQPGGTANVKDMFVMQQKMNTVQQQVGIFTVVLGKILSNIQMIMGIQN
jgi:hypothetical protein